MSKANEKALKLLQKSTNAIEFEEKFEEQEKALTATFRTIFDTIPISDSEKVQLYNLLGASTEDLPPNEVNADHQNLVEITTQIRAIERQSIVLHGERIYKAQQILKKYNDGTFSKWLQLAYGSRQTPYNMLQFYDLFKKLEKDEKELMNAMPKRAAYALASRSGEIEKKIEIIKEYHDSSPDEIIEAVRQAFPLKEKDKRGSTKKTNDAELLKTILTMIRKLRERKSLEKVLSMAESLLSQPTEKVVDPNEIDMFEKSK